MFGVLGWAALGWAARRAGCWLHCGGGLYKLLPAPENMWSLSSLNNQSSILTNLFCVKREKVNTSLPIFIWSLMHCLLTNIVSESVAKTTNDANNAAL